MAPEVVNRATATMRLAWNAAVTATAPSVTVPARTEMSDNGEPTIDDSRVSRLLDMRKEQLNLAEQAEYQLMRAL